MPRKKKKKNITSKAINYVEFDPQLKLQYETLGLLPPNAAMAPLVLSSCCTKNKNKSQMRETAEPPSVLSSAGLCKVVESVESPR